MNVKTACYGLVLATVISGAGTALGVEVRGVIIPQKTFIRGEYMDVYIPPVRVASSDKEIQMHPEDREKMSIKVQTNHTSKSIDAGTSGALQAVHDGMKGNRGR